jgi:flagellar basal body-associated protein FliL
MIASRLLCRGVVIGLIVGKGSIMSEKAEKKPQTDEGAAKAPEKKSGLLTKTSVLLGGVMLIEAIVLIGGFKFLGGKPQGAEAALITADEAQGADKADAKKGKTVEVPLVEFKALNRSNGHTFLFDVSIFVVTKSDNEARITETFKTSKALIEDRIRTIIAESDPEKLSGGAEPGLETLRRQVKYQLDRILGDGVIDQVLVPRCIPFRTDY